MLNSVLQYLEATQKRYPDKAAFCDDSESLTFTDVCRISQSIATRLARNIPARTPVLCLMDRSPLTVCAMFGIAYAGCIWICCEPATPVGRLSDIIRTTSPATVLYDGKNEKAAKMILDKVKSCGYTGNVLDCRWMIGGEIDSGLLTDISERAIDTDPLYIVFTSGSTGTPKGVTATVRSVRDYAEALCETLPFDEHTVFGNQSPLCYDAPLKEILPTVVLGCTVRFIPKMLFSFPVPLCKYITEHGINTICWVVSALTTVSTLGALTDYAPSTLSVVCFGSEVFPRAQYDIWRTALPHTRFFNLYGPTEATGMSCYWEADRSLGDEPIPIGRPFPNTRVLLLSDGHEVKDGDVGEIHLCGTCVTAGYYGADDKTQASYIRNPLNKMYPEIIYKTGDLAYYNERHELIYVSRVDAQVKVMGHRVELGEIEAAADKCGISSCCCVFDKDTKRLILFYVKPNGRDELDSKELNRMLGEWLPKYMIPNICVQLACLPKTPGGKIDRAELAAQARNLM